MKTYKKYSSILFDIINGLYSGFPLCCIANYVKLRLNGYAPSAEMSKLYGDDYSNVEYVRCIKCRNNNHLVTNIRKGRFPSP